MRIVCPNCLYERDIPDDKIPQAAALATCPKCRHKFSFREQLEDLAGLPEPVPPMPEAAPEDPADAGRAESVETVAAPEASDTPESPVGEQAPPPLSGEQEPARDIWQSLERMAPEPERDQTPGSEPGPDRQARHDGRDEGSPPWERLDRYGFFHGLVQTVRQVMFAAPRFFRAMPLGRGMNKPLIFYLLVSEFQAVAQYMWQNMAGMAAQAPSVDPTAVVGGLNSGLMLLVYPAIFTLALFVSVSINHFFLMMFQASSGGYEGTFRAVAYGSAPMVLGAIPAVGPMAGALWSLVATIIGYKILHRTTFFRVGLSIVVPVALLFVVAVMLSAGSQQAVY